MPGIELPPAPPDGANIGNWTSNLPQNFALDQNFPNPFNPLTVIRYQLPVESRVKLKISNILGQEVKRLADEIQDAGYKSVVWNSTNDQGNPVASGIYFYRMEATSVNDPTNIFSQVRKLILMR